MSSQLPPPPPNFGEYPGQAPMGPVNNYMVFAILTTIFCCLPFGVVGIVNAAQVNSKLAAGDYAGAVNASKQARLWSFVSLGVALGISVVYVLIIFIGTAASSGSY